MYLLYRTFSSLASPFVPLLLKHRQLRGKEDAERLPERLGVASLPRPKGPLVWIHAASVGEANAVLPLIEALLAEHENAHVLLTTVTLTSATLMKKQLPPRALHQFAPVDTPKAVRKFLDHWRPDIALFVDSEIWPNLLVETRRRDTLMGLVNARMSERSFRRWQRVLPFIRELLAGFTLCFAQSEADGERLRSLGIPAISRVGNLKYDAPPLPYDETVLIRLRADASGRPVWVAASTHPGEETIIAEVHAVLARDGLRPLTIVVPRHASRGDEVVAALAPLKVARRSKREPILLNTDIYLADTMGELGLFYRLASIAFIGGTLVEHGGQNPLEAARLGCAVIAGPHMENFAAIAAAMEAEGALVRVQDGQGLMAGLSRLLPDGAARATLAAAARAHVHAHGGVLAAITQELRPAFSGIKS